MSCYLRRYIQLLVAMLLLPKQESCWGFVRYEIPFVPLHYRKQLLSANKHGREHHHHIPGCSQAKDDDASSLYLEEESEESDDDRVQPRKEVELWLDLRGTALFPSEAMDYLNENIFGFSASSGSTCSRIVDRVVLSEQTMEKLIMQEQKQQQQGSKQANFLYVPSKGDDLVLCSQDQSLPCGKVIRQQADATSVGGGGLFNPILAMEIVTTNRGWILMEQREERHESVWMEEISSLLTFLWSSSSVVGSGLDLIGGGGGLVLGEEDEDEDEDSSSSPLYSTPVGNGMAIACPSGSLLMEVSKAIMTLTSVPRGASTSPGGILLPTSAGGSSMEEDDLFSIIVPNGSNNDHERDEEQLSIAIVLPLDVTLWKTAIDLVIETNDSSSSESEFDLR